MKLKDYDAFCAIQKRFINGRGQNESQLYERVLHQMKVGVRSGGFRTKEDFNKWCEAVDKSFEQIKLNGYQTQGDLLANKQPFCIHTENEMSVYINRAGQLMLGDGIHRLAMAKILGIERIPVKVAMRHKNWVRFRMEMISYIDSRMEGKAYVPLIHPDLQDIPALHDGKRFDILKPHILSGSGTLLDIGAHWGYFCHRFEELGFNCFAVEAHSPHVYFLQKLRDAQNRRFHVIPKSIFEYREDRHFDIVLALNVFHHFIKSKESHQQLINFLKRLDTEIMFFEPHLPEAEQMVGAYRNYGCDEFVNFVMEHSGLTHCNKIGKADDGRPIYKLYK